ncbi:dihydrodipicolinate reductase [Geomonas nitrogeniifigens]|uniref:4-hydroxy-tetrahydrodipicolinate reductase n=1 Tax=Geomonas diazotrophica TaxID=2843197 RepID=A0ABX8JDH9_9BACT|nr:dihydrodipicolinate reductase C-terminal domain-containing protein [Geomonas nitrogeniifigens]QWV96454.1 dihydrodipicolinate reductase [Geomonas nitrogeniifigens]QXE86461.1 dihydrodipicolinate reductase [Geomonas nitrogeniifigens]
MKVGLIGFGKTGKAVASVLLQSKETNLQWVVRRSHNLEHRSVPEFLGIESEEPGYIYSADEFAGAELLERFPVDVIIDFSSEQGVRYYGEAARDRKVAVVSAISSYSAQTVAYLKYLAQKTRVLWSPNITVGINFLIIAARILKNIAPYTDIEIVEEHFKAKPEVSGTAKKIASSLGLEEDVIKTVRAGGIIGVHEILFGFPYQTVRLKHESITREAFGNGVLFAAKHLHERGAGLYSMEDLMLPYFNAGSAQAA